MPTIGYRLLAAPARAAAAGAPPPNRRRLRCGAASTSPTGSASRQVAIRRRCARYLDDTALEICGAPGSPSSACRCSPNCWQSPGALADAVARLQRHGLAVVVALFADRLAPGDRRRRPGAAAGGLALAGAGAAPVRSGRDISRGAERAGVRRRTRTPGPACSTGCGGRSARSAGEYHRAHRRRLGQRGRPAGAARRKPTPT